jgi:hypothetical protein
MRRYEQDIQRFLSLSCKNRSQRESFLAEHRAVSQHILTNLFFTESFFWQTDGSLSCYETAEPLRVVFRCSSCLNSVFPRIARDEACEWKILYSCEKTCGITNAPLRNARSFPLKEGKKQT